MPAWVWVLIAVGVVVVLVPFRRATREPAAQAGMVAGSSGAAL